MHELFTLVLGKRDLSKAGDLFSVPDEEIVNDLTEVLSTVHDITSAPDYVRSDNDQSVVEICITRVTSALRDTESMETHADAVVALLQSCLNHSLKPTGEDEDPPHAKIAADIISSIFLNYNKKEVMKKALPVAVKFLHKGNKELSRNLSSYLSLAGIENAQLLAQHIQLIIDSIISGNYTLSRVLPQVYAVDKEALEEHAMALVSLLPLCEDPEKLALLNLFALIASNKPSLLEPSLPQLREYLTQGATASACMQVFLNLAERRPQSLVDHLASVKNAAACHPATLCLAAKVISSVGKLSKDRAQEALNFVLEHLPKADRGSQGTLLREATLLCSSYPVLFTEKMLQEVRQVGSNSGSRISPPNHSSQAVPVTTTTTSGNVTIVKLGGGGSKSDLMPVKEERTNKVISATPRPRSTIRLDTTPHRSMTRLSGGGSRAGSVGGLHKSMTRLSSSQQIHQQLHHVNQQTQQQNDQQSMGVQVQVGRSAPMQSAPNHFKITSGGVTVLASGDNSSPLKSISRSRDETRDCRDSQVSVTTTQSSSAPALKHTVSVLSPVAAMTQSSGAVTHRRLQNNNNVTVISNQAPASNQRMSVFEPYPMRDTVQHFCEKHLDKIKTYMEKVSLQIPPPAKCTIEERRAKKLAKLDFACQGRGEHCLYKRTFFTMRTRNPRTWIHLMFLTLQAKSPTALSSRDASVSSLKHCWDMLKCESKTFLTVVTSAFPCAREQEALLAELRANGFQDVLGLVRRPPPQGPLWVCFLCNHPEKAQGFLQDSQPVIEGQLKEKKGKWKMFKRWRTRYFTLSGAHLSYKISKDDTDVAGIDVKQIRSVKVSRGARNIPKAFEIFTGDRSLILKPKGGKNAEEWVQCLSAVVAHSQTRDTSMPGKTYSLPARTAV